MTVAHIRGLNISKEMVQKFMLGKLVDFSIRWVDGVLLVH